MRAFAARWYSPSRRRVWVAWYGGNARAGVRWDDASRDVTADREALLSRECRWGLDAVYSALKLSPSLMTSGQMGDKQVMKSPEWGTTYLYLTGDTAFAVEGAEPDHAETILAALH